MPRPRSISDEAIKAAAREVFVTHGPSASVASIAAELGVTHAALFQRVGSKQRLLLEALCPGEPEAAAWLRAGPPATGVRERLVEILAELMGFLQRVVPNLVILRAAGRSPAELAGGEGPGAGPGEPPPVALRRALSEWLAAADAVGSLRVQAPAALAEALLGAMEARCFNAYLGGQAFAPGDDRPFLAGLITGLLPPQPEERDP